MNIVFFGSSNFAVPSLKALLAMPHKITCVVTQPDRLKGRGLHLGGTAVKTTALEAGLKIYQPKVINAKEAIEFLRGLSADLFIVVSYGQILSQEMLDLPAVFAINIHASLLPKYRGAAPINWAIINGEKITGVTIMKMAKKMDAGPIIMQKSIDIAEDDTAITLADKLSHLGAQLLGDSLNALMNNSYKLIPQEKNKVSFAPKLKKEDGLIGWDNPAKDIHNLIRGCLVWPSAFTYYNGKLLKILKSRIATERFPGKPAAGKIIEVSKAGIAVAAGMGSLIIEELQIEGKRVMEAEEFIAGHKIRAGEVLGKE
jgi:methionyl-tRNA formyltransferase